MYLRNNNNFSLFFRSVAWFVIIAFSSSMFMFPQKAQAQIAPQTVLNLPVPGAFVTASPAFNPAVLKGVQIDTSNPLHFNFIIDKGDNNFDKDSLKAESSNLVKYFLTALTVPENEMWVNLNPEQEDKITPETFGQTEMGRDLLAQDYILKQLTASLMYPENELGSKFWEAVYEKAYEKYGAIDVSTDVFNKVWIVPEKAVVYVNEGTAFIVESKLKVMLEEEFLGRGKGQESGGKENFIHADAIKEIVMPAIEKEINEGKNFAQLRQIYNSIILAAWYKQELKNSLLGQVYVDKNRTKGIDVEDKDIKKKIYDQYLASFKEGVCNYIREEYDPTTQSTVAKKYFTGGTSFKLSEKDGPGASMEVFDSAMMTVPAQVMEQMNAYEKDATAKGQIFNTEVLLAEPGEDVSEWKKEEAPAEAQADKAMLAVDFTRNIIARAGAKRALKKAKVGSNKEINALLNLIRQQQKDEPKRVYNNLRDLVSQLKKVVCRAVNEHCAFYNIQSQFMLIQMLLVCTDKGS